MSRPARSAELRAERLLRWYPLAWRERYGEEFAELLAADIAERPQSLSRTADVAVSGMCARLSLVGLGSGPVVAPQVALATLGTAMVAFLVCGLSLWSQLLVGWRWSPPDGHAVTLGLVGLSVVVVALSVCAVLAAAPVVSAVLTAATRRDGRRLVRPMALLVIGIVVLVAGGHHLAGAWPGTGGQRGEFAAVLPHGIAGFAWAETLGITTFWAHPTDLAALPAAQVAWIVVSPIAYAASIVGGVNLVRRLELSPAVLGFEARLARVALTAMLPCLAAAAWWVVSSQTGSSSVFRAGSLDVLLIASMAGALAVTRLAARRLSTI